MKFKVLIILLLFLLLPISLFAANEIRIEAKPTKEMKELSIDCNTLNLSTLRIFLTRKTIPTKVYFYSAIYYNDILGTAYYIARTDILNRYVFISYGPGEPIRSQFYGMGFIILLNYWEDTAFYDVFKHKTCAELKQYHFIYGFSSKTDMSDFEGAEFYFK